MTNTALLLEWIKKSGYRRSFLAEQLNLSYYGFQLKIQNEHEFKPSEINKLCKLLGITSLRDKDRIFFAKEVEKMAT